jgi:tetratricopeptide (TPR) repeat protein
MNRHPSPSDFARFLRGQLPPLEARELVLHMVRGCQRCAVHFLPELSPAESYEAIFEHFVSPAGPKPSPSLLWAELEPLLPNQRRLKLQKRRYRSRSFASWLTHHSRSISPEDGQGAVLAAELALSVVDQLVFHSDVTEDLAHDLRAAALTNLGGALRSLGRFAQSLDAFVLAEEELAASTDSLLRSEFLSLRARLLRDLGQFSEAAKDLRTAYELVEESDSTARGRILVQLAEVVGLDNDPSAAIEILEAAAVQIDPTREPGLQLVLNHRLAWYLNDAGSPGLAMEVLRSSWPLYGPFPETWIRGYRSWLWGRIERSFGEPRQAEVYVSRAVDLFRELGAARDHAVSGLDLADVYLRLGEAREARLLLLESLDFLEPHLHSQGLAHWFDLARTASLTPDLLARATSYFRRFWHVPSEPAA